MQLINPDITRLNTALDSKEYSIASLGDTFSTVKDGVLYRWQWLNVMVKSSMEDFSGPKHYIKDEATLQDVKRALQVHFPKLDTHLFYADELGVSSCPDYVLAVCISKEELPEPGQYT